MTSPRTAHECRVGHAAPRSEYLILLTLCLGVLVAQVDTSVVNLAIQPIGVSFGTTIGALQWVLDGYNLTYAALLLSGGLVADLYGRRLAFQVGAAVIGVGSLICAAAPGIGLLIAARVGVGVGSALLLPASLAIVRVVWTEPVRRGWALGIWASCNGLAFALGPTVGGFLIGWLGWPSVFLLAVPLVVASFVLAGRVVPESAHPQDRHLDVLGQVLGVVMLAAGVYAAIEAHQGGVLWLMFLALAIAACLMFLVVEHRRGESALVPLPLFRQAPFRGAMTATASMTFGIYGMIFLLPLVWQTGRVLGSEGAGLGLLPCALVFFLVSPRTGALAARFGARLLIAGGTSLIAVGLLVLAATRGGQPLLLAEGGLMLAGLGMGLNTGPLMSVAVDAVEPGRSGTAASLINAARMTGARWEWRCSVRFSRSADAAPSDCAAPWQSAQRCSSRELWPLGQRLDKDGRGTHRLRSSPTSSTAEHGPGRATNAGVI